MSHQPFQMLTSGPRLQSSSSLCNERSESTGVPRKMTQTTRSFSGPPRGCATVLFHVNRTWYWHQQCCVCTWCDTNVTPLLVTAQQHSNDKPTNKPVIIRSGVCTYCSTCQSLQYLEQTATLRSAWHEHYQRCSICRVRFCAGNIFGHVHSPLTMWHDLHAGKLSPPMALRDMLL